MASARSGAAVAEPRSRPRPKPAPKKKRTPATKPRTSEAPRSRRQAKTRARSRGGIAWIVIAGALLAGVVFVNVLVLQLNLKLDTATREQAALKASNATLQSQLSVALALPRIQALAHSQDGLVQADPSKTVYLNLGK